MSNKTHIQGDNKVEEHAFSTLQHKPRDILKKLLMKFEGINLSYKKIIKSNPLSSMI